MKFTPFAPNKLERLAVIVSVSLFLGACLLQAAERELTIKDNIGRAWENEPITWELTFKPGEWPGKGLGVSVNAQPVVQRNGEPIAAQTVARERHADGSVKRATIRLVIDKLAKDARTTIKLDTSKAKASVLVVKVKDKKNASLSLLAGTEAKFGRLKIKSTKGVPKERVLINNKRRPGKARNFLKK